MQLEIVGLGTAEPLRTEELRRHPTFRKATRAMSLACAAIDSALASEPGLLSVLKRSDSRFGLVLSSAFGELETTKDFLKTLADVGVARPLLFQNSLHNSTSGFVSIHFRITGPVVTVSHGLFAFEHALEVANLLLQQGQCDFLPVTYVETFVSDLVETESASAHAAVDLATTLILTTTSVAQRERLRSRGRILDVRCDRKFSLNGGEGLPTYCTTVFSGPTSAEVVQRAIVDHQSDAQRSQEISIEKFGGARSLVQWQPADSARSAARREL